MSRRDALTADLFEQAPPPIVSQVCAEIAVPVPIDKAFTYLVPADLPHEVSAGSRVLVPFAGRRLMGLVLDVRPRTDDDGPKLKAILGVVDPAPVLPAELLSFLREVARYYLAPIGEVMALALPAVERKTIRRMRAEGVQPSATAKVAPEHVTRFVRKTATAPLLPQKKLGPAARA
ncbi:MAG: hypothetical protein ABI175_08865, partial [Polyangiales bacterium]